MPSGSEEINLARAAAAGDGPAFACLYEAYERRIFNYLLRLLGDRHEAEDATQDTFIKVMAKLPELDLDDLQFGPYLYTAARNAGYDVIAKRKRMEPTGAVPEEAESPHRGQLSDLDIDPERAALASSQESAVRAANARLPERQREVLSLRELDGLSYDEIGSVMEMKPNAVAQLISRARIGLRKEMRAGAAASVALATPECDRAHGALACRQDGQQTEDAWLDGHLAGCANCRVAAEEMAEAGVSYRAWAPVVPAAWLFREVMAKASEINGHDWSGVERPSPDAPDRSPMNGAGGGGAGAAGAASGASGRGRRVALVGLGSALVAGIFAILLLGDAEAPERVGAVNESFTVAPSTRGEDGAARKRIARKAADGKRIVGRDPETGEPILVSPDPTDGGSVSTTQTQGSTGGGRDGGGGGTGGGDRAGGGGGDTGGDRPSGGGGTTDTPDPPPVREPVDPVDPTPPTTPPPTTPPPTPPTDPTPIPGGPPNLAIPGGPKPG